MIFLLFEYYNRLIARSNRCSGYNYINNYINNIINNNIKL